MRIDTWDAAALRSGRNRRTATRPPRASRTAWCTRPIHGSPGSCTYIRPAIWRAAARLRHRDTAVDVEYGSRRDGTARSHALAPDQSGVRWYLSRSGHEDGVFACGATADETGAALVRRARTRGRGDRRDAARPNPSVGMTSNSSLLDQTPLPTRTVFEQQPSLESVFAAIRALKVRGAPAIGIAAAYGLVVAMQPHRDATGDVFMQRCTPRHDRLAHRAADRGESRLGHRSNRGAPPNRTAMARAATNGSRRPPRPSTRKTGACAGRSAGPGNPSITLRLRRADALQRGCAGGFGTGNRHRADVSRTSGGRGFSRLCRRNATAAAGQPA